MGREYGKGRKGLVQARVSEEEGVLIEERAKGAGVSVSEWVRGVLRAALAGSPVDPPVVTESRAPEKSVAKGQFLLCPRCSRVGAPSCDECRKAALSGKVPVRQF